MLASQFQDWQGAENVGSKGGYDLLLLTLFHDSLPFSTSCPSFGLSILLPFREEWVSLALCIDLAEVRDQ